MPRKNATAASKSEGFLDLTLRIRNDGGPVYKCLAGIKDSHLRGDRVRQLLYFGLMREHELMRDVHSRNGSAERGQEGTLAEVTGKNTPLPSPAPMPAANEVIFAAEDLASVFGGL